MDRLEEVARAIVHVYAGVDGRTTKDRLLSQRREVLDILARALGPTWTCPELPDPLDLEAYRVVLNYNGTNRFIRDLNRHIEAHGLLTERQIEALLGPPFAMDVDTLKRHGIDVPEYAWEAREIVNRLGREAAARARAERTHKPKAHLSGCPRAAYPGENQPCTCDGYGVD